MYMDGKRLSLNSIFIYLYIYIFLNGLYTPALWSSTMKNIFFKEIKIPDDQKLDTILVHKKRVLITSILIEKKKQKVKK